MSEQFDPLKAYALLREAAAARPGPKLKQAEHFHAFALLKAGVSHSIISKMFGISLSSISHLANCEMRKHGMVLRYPHVRREWLDLGAEEFIKTYLTEDNTLRAERLKSGAEKLLDDRTAYASNPRADSYCYDLRGLARAGEIFARVDWVECNNPDIPAEQKGPIGWRYAYVDEHDEPKGPYVSIAPYDEPVREDGLWMPWRTSGEAFDHPFIVQGLKSPRRPGRPRK